MDIGIVTQREIENYAGHELFSPNSENATYNVCTEPINFGRLRTFMATFSIEFMLPVPFQPSELN